MESILKICSELPLIPFIVVLFHILIFAVKLLVGDFIASDGQRRLTGYEVLVVTDWVLLSSL